MVVNDLQLMKQEVHFLFDIGKDSFGSMRTVIIIIR